MCFSNDVWLAKATGAEPSGQMIDEKVHAAVARSTFPSQNLFVLVGLSHTEYLVCQIVAA